MHPNEALIHRFYEALMRKDGAAMAACYAPDGEFCDPAFGLLTAAEAGAMWRMLTARARDLSVALSAVSADAEQGSAHWDATYTFSKTGRIVRNRIDARFRFRDGLILSHVDRFSLWRWAAMAMGPVGAVLGWTPPLRKAIRRQSRAALDAWIKRERDAD
ncbi:nuclear transport factor 2 family protein [Niveibacterium sp. 24ML]|uniref:nuclear transport factor 2 family protein n=1 Tax=Niveibacterium sp. 24ML TaxID=2985512 RepID=UPI0022702B5E|nr:nuclear transport factor 2 family protein [Niveibacterium sp. 24ML]MCX9156899.1 nuclear transport factor 2 family protein [Niveibacterium sp. 24ML]